MTVGAGGQQITIRQTDHKLVNSRKIKLKLSFSFKDMHQHVKTSIKDYFHVQYILTLFQLSPCAETDQGGFGVGRGCKVACICGAAVDRH